jgi:hypothetical protein
LPQKRDWVASFGQSFGKEVPRSSENQEINAVKEQKVLSKRHEKEADYSSVKASPLDLTGPQASKFKGKIGLIVAAVVMVLGLILLTMQSLK